MKCAIHLLLLCFLTCYTANIWIRHRHTCYLLIRLQLWPLSWASDSVWLVSGFIWCSHRYLQINITRTGRGHPLSYTPISHSSLWWTHWPKSGKTFLSPPHPGLFSYAVEGQSCRFSHVWCLYLSSISLSPAKTVTAMHSLSLSPNVLL